LLCLKESIKLLEDRIKELEFEINKLKIENKELKKSITASQTAKHGYSEEVFVKDYINKNKDKLNIFLKDQSDFDCVLGNTKTDIANETINIQVKKYKDGQFGQVDRHYVDDLINNIPELKPIKKYLKNMCELPLNKEGTCNKTKLVIKLNKNNYKEDELKILIDTLNKYKKKIVRHVLYGSNEKYKPYILCGVKYKDGNRTTIIFYKMKDVINYICKSNFIIRLSGTVIQLGDAFTMQRKGGDGGKKSANNLQFKLIFSKLDIDNKIQFNM